MKRLKKPAFLLALERDCWRVCRVLDAAVDVREVPFPDDPSPASGAPAVAVALKEMGYAGQKACLGLPASMVMAAQVDCSSLPRRHRHESLLYKLEEQLPIEAERLTATFTNPSGGQALGMAVVTQPIRTVLEALSAEGVDVWCICPTSLLVLWHGQKRLETADFALVAWPEHLDIFRLKNGAPLAWYNCPLEGHEAGKLMQADLLIRPLECVQTNVVVFGEISDKAHIEQAIPARMEPASSQPALTDAAIGLEESLNASGTTWIDLRHGGLSAVSPWARFAGRLRFAAAAAILLLVGAIVLLVYRGWRYNVLASDYEQAQQAQYRKAYPTSVMPANVHSRLQSEVAKLSGLCGSGQNIPIQRNGLLALRQVIAGLPPQKLRINEIRIDPAGVFIEGQALSHTDAAAVSQALSRGGLIADPPKTEQLPKGEVAFSTTAHWADAAAAGGAR